MALLIRVILLLVRSLRLEAVILWQLDTNQIQWVMVVQLLVKVLRLVPQKNQEDSHQPLVIMQLRQKIMQPL